VYPRDEEPRRKEYDGTWEKWKHGALPIIDGDATCDCPCCRAVRQEKAAAIERSEQRAKDTFKRELLGQFKPVEPLFGKSPGASAAEIMARWKELALQVNPPKFVPDKSLYDLMAYGKSFNFIPRPGVMPKLAGFTPKYFGIDFAFEEFTSTTPTKPIPKHRKAAKKVAKAAVKTANQTADEHVDEATDLIEDARSILKAADALNGMRVVDVEHSMTFDKTAGRITITFKKIDQEEIETVREDYIDKAVYMAWVNGGAGLALDVQSLLQKAGRDLLTKSTLSLTRLVTPEINAMRGNNGGGGGGNASPGPAGGGASSSMSGQTANDKHPTLN